MPTDPEQGPDAGRRLSAAAATYADSTTGATVTRLTDSRAHDHHLYFTRSGWYDGGRRLLFASDRTGRPNLYAYDLADEAVVQLTDLPEPSGSRGFRGFQFPFQFASLDPDAPAAYFWHDHTLCRLDLESLALDGLYERPAGFLTNMTDVTADGEAVVTVLVEDVRDAVPADVGWTPMQRKGPGFERVWRAMPTSRVVDVPVGGGDPAVLHEEDHWLAHCNASPTRPDLLTFCHYGPWTEIEHRAWVLDRGTGDIWKLRSEAPDGTPSPPTMHEYWLADGERLGYWGYDGAGDPVYGTVRYDDTDQVEVRVHGATGNTLPHFHSHRPGRVVGDGNADVPAVLVWEGEDTAGLRGPRVVASHDCSWHTQVTHVHPRLSPDGGRVVYTSDRSGYANVYLVDLPDFGALPRAEGL